MMTWELKLLGLLIKINWVALDSYFMTYEHKYTGMEFSVEVWMFLNHFSIYFVFVAYSVWSNFVVLLSSS
jgi:hypothetical protein